MQNVNSGVTQTPSASYAPPSGAGDSSPAAARIGDVLPTPGLNSRPCPPEHANGIESITNRNVESARGPQCAEIDGASRDIASTDAASTPSVSSERAMISAMRKEMIQSYARHLLTKHARLSAVSTSGNTRGQLKLKITADHDCSQEERQQLQNFVVNYLKDNVPQRLLNEFTLVLEYGGPVEFL